jgi:predicted lipid-binding transport protein (Tim44 family)
MKLWSVFLALVMVLSSTEVWAQKRMGGGMSFGKQSGNVTQRNTPPAQPAQAPAQNAAQTPNRPATAPAQAPASRPWGAMLGGLAAGLGLAWLASSLGLGEAFGQILMFLLLGVAVLAIIAMVRRHRAGASASPLALQGAGGQAAARSYSPSNVGNDASARPWEQAAAPTATPAPSGQGGGSMIGSALSGHPTGGAALAGSESWGIPADFDTEGFLRASKANFVRLQDAWDRADIPALRAMMTDEMVEQIQSQLADREQQSGGATSRTEVVMLEAQLLGIEELDDEYMASVEFSGLIREEPSAGPVPFREVWNITKPKAGGGWRVAGLQSLQ